MAQLVQCVPNFSEGRHKEIIESIANAITITDGVSLLDVDPGPSTNRTLYTFIGPPEAVLEAALTAARAASQLIDMTRQNGEHPRLGSLDVCPFIPIKNITLEECAILAKIFGQKLAEEIGVPVYLYGAAANPEAEHRQTVSQIRVGEYESLEDKLKDPEWVPDFGPADFISPWGATMVGARKSLISYNVNILGTKEQAHRIALNIREQGRSPEEPGRLKGVQGIGWYLDEHNVAQISLNICDIDETPLHLVYDEVCKDARELNLGIVGSQISGLIPLKAIIDTADHYIKNENLFILEEDQKIRLVVQRLGLNCLGAFSAKERIIEFMVPEADADGPLVSMDLREFTLTVGSRTPTPGGASVAAFVGSLGAALATMSGLLTFGRKEFDEMDKEMRELLPPLYQTTRSLLPIIDDVALSAHEYKRVGKLFTETEEEEKGKHRLEQRVLGHVLHVPFALAQQVGAIWPILTRLAKTATLTTRADMQTAARCLQTAVWGAQYFIKSNLTSFDEHEEARKMQEEMNRLTAEADTCCAEILKLLEERKE